MRGMPRDARPGAPTSISIREQADLVLKLAPADRLKMLTEAPRPMALVRALPDGDFYLTVREVGPLDALPILALASASQLTHLLDLESWRGDRFDPLRSGAWVALIAETDEATLRRFVRNADDEALALLLRDWARLRPLEIDHEEPTRGHGITEHGDERGFVSPDGAHLAAPERSEHAPAVRRFLEMLFIDDEGRYRGLVRAAQFELPSEIEEQALRWRGARLEEHGYPPFEEALSAYAPPAAALRIESSPPAPGDGPAPPRSALRVLGPGDGVVAAVAALPEAERERVLFELAALANRVLVADRDDPGSPEAHRRVVARAGSYVGLALESRRAETPAAAAETLAATSVVELFREGYALASRLQERARRQAVPVRALLDPPHERRVAALLAPRPLYVAVAVDGTESERDFRRLAEIEETALHLLLIETLDAALLRARGTSPAALAAEERLPFEGAPRFSTLLLTALAWHAARGILAVGRLPADVVADFLRTTASRRTAPAEAPRRAMERLIDHLVREGAFDRRAAAALATFGATALEILEADCASLDPGVPVTPRVVGCLRLS